MSRRRPHVDDAEVRALEERLRVLLAACGSVSEGEIALWEADREQLLDRIGDQLRAQRAHDAARARLRAELDAPTRWDDADGWVAGGLEAAHRAHLDSLAHLDEPVVDTTALGRTESVIHDVERNGSDVPDNAGRRLDEAATDEHVRWSDASRDDAEYGDRDRVRDDGPGSSVGGLWFTLDQAAPGGTRPLSEAELRELTDRVRATQAEALAQELEPSPFHSSTGRGYEAAEEAGWDR